MHLTLCSNLSGKNACTGQTHYHKVLAPGINPASHNMVQPRIYLQYHHDVYKHFNEPVLIFMQIAKARLFRV